MAFFEQSVSIPEDVLVRVIDGESVLLNLDDENYYGLDDVSTIFWEAITESDDLAAAMTSLLGRFDVDEERLRADFVTFVEELVSIGLVRLRPIETSGTSQS